ncbi:MAG: hypothetical protein R3A12_05390 [Ignavibacteria bacterium]
MKKTAKISVTENKKTIASGLTDLLVLKTTDSGFENFIKTNILL